MSPGLFCRNLISLLASASSSAKTRCGRTSPLTATAMASGPTATLASAPPPPPPRPPPCTPFFVAALAAVFGSSTPAGAYEIQYTCACPCQCRCVLLHPQAARAFEAAVWPCAPQPAFDISMNHRTTTSPRATTARTWIWCRFDPCLAAIYRIQRALARLQAQIKNKAVKKWDWRTR
jgi:hypothetical protein